jgi:hypothetical protein
MMTAWSQPPLPPWLLLTALGLFLVFVGSAVFSVKLDLDRQARDEWLRGELLRQQAEQNQHLQDIRSAVESSLATLAATWQGVIRTQETVERTEEKVEGAQKALIEIKETAPSDHGRPSEP